MPMWSDPSRRSERVVFTSDSSHYSPPPALSRQLSEESIRTELCDGPLQEETPDAAPTASSDAILSLSQPNARQELIERLKKEQSPTWSPAARHQPIQQATSKTPDRPEPPPETRIDDIKRSPPLLLPAIELKNIGTSSRDGPNSCSADTRLISGYEIERPKSALHAGDFTETQTKSVSKEDAVSDWRDSISNESKNPPQDPYTATPEHRTSHTRRPSLQVQPSTPAIPINQRQTRSRAPSLHSYSSSFILKAPTSPLVQQANNDDLDLSPNKAGSSRNKENRRHTLPPHSLQSLRSLNSGLAQAARQPFSLHREDTFPLTGSQQNRRSLGSGFPLAGSSPSDAPFSVSRWPSFSGDVSPRPHASMVGSYEESILRGRMSATPSKPLEFTAQIGALGKGDCRYKHPAHVSVQFPAVFHSWSSSNSSRTPSNDEPSPYVGQVDLEHNLPPPKRKEKKSRRRGGINLDDHSELGESPSRHAAKRRDTRKRRSRSPSPMNLPIGGCYRIPREGHLQILIKNPNKTAVKLFLVPYDLHGMEAGTKTFIRQKCYSAGPIIENPITSKSASDTAIDTKTMLNDSSKSKPTLRYLIHLQICSPSKGRFYLYKNISVVFANRVPDNKENLKNEIRLPEPRYSPYKPDPTQPAFSTETSKRQARRRSYNFGTSTSHPFDATSPVLGFSLESERARPSGTGNSIPPVPPVPFPFNTPEQTPQQHPLPLPLPTPPSLSLNAALPSEQANVQTHGSSCSCPSSPARQQPEHQVLTAEPSEMDLDPPSPSPGPPRPLPADCQSTIYYSQPAYPMTTRSPFARRLAFPSSTTAAPSSGMTSPERSSTGPNGGLRDSPSARSIESAGTNGTNGSEGSGSYSKLSRGDVGYGGVFGRPGTPEPGEGLLARKLRGLDVEARGLNGFGLGDGSFRRSPDE